MEKTQLQKLRKGAVTLEEQLKQLIKEALKEALAESNITVQKSDGFPEIMDLEQAANFVHLSKDYIRNKKDELAIPHKRAGRAYLFMKSELLEWMQGREDKKNINIKATAVKSRGKITKIV